MTLQEYIKTLPAPLNSETFTLKQKGIWENGETEVYGNEGNDFAFLFPTPKLDYDHYIPRSQQLNLLKYKSARNENDWRFSKLEPHLKSVGSFLEIGASNAGFLDRMHSEFSQISFSCVEPDQDTKLDRDALDWLQQYQSLDEIIESGVRFDMVGFFHVFEHISSPAGFIEQCKKVLNPGGQLVIEVPNLDDPLLSLYKLDAYQKFYFQHQHPFVYSSSSLKRVIEHQGLAVQETIYHQRYSLENHLSWLKNEAPGGDEQLRKIFSPIEDQYRSLLEDEGKSDTVIIIAGAAE